jgi:1,4-dihydroxy-2-naphthoate octaprenyltransferase
MTPAEPTLEALSNPVQRYFLATRPPFLSVSLLAALVGIAAAWHDRVVLWPATAVMTVLFALVAHAAVNVLNDYYDELNGTDRLNTDRLFPFTGGSRFIQNGVITARATLVFGLLLLTATILAGLWLASVAGSGLIWIGLAGCFVGWAYSATPFKLNGRGLGEPCVAIGFGLIAVGADYVQRKGFAPLPVTAVTSYALLVMNILYINQFPDLKADQAAGKHHWVVRLGTRVAPAGYAVIGAVGYLWLAGAVALGMLPKLALVPLATAALTFPAARQLFAHAGEPARLEGAIKQTIAAANVHGLLMVLALVFGR